MRFLNVILGVLVGLSISSATTVTYSGNLYSALTPNTDTVYISSATTIKPGASLTMGAGQVLRLSSAASITVQGKLILKGVEGDSVHVVASTTSWKSIIFDNSSNIMATDSSLFEYVVFRSSSASALRIKAFNYLRFSHCRFTANQNATPNSSDLYFGGAMSVFSSSFKIEHSLFDQNRSLAPLRYGGAIYWKGGSPKLSNTLFTLDTAENGSSFFGEYLDTLLINNSQFGGVSAKEGGSLTIDSSVVVTIRNTMFDGTTNNQPQIVSISKVRNMLLENDTIQNYARTDGISPTILQSDSLVIRNSIFRKNSQRKVSGAAVGGALLASGRFVRLSGVLAYENTLQANSGTASGGFASITGSDSLNITHCTFSKNTATGSTNGYGGAAALSSNAVIANSIIWGNSPGSVTAGTSYFTIGSTDPDPLFVDATSGDYRLQAGSPALDAGYIHAYSIPTKDLDGKARSKYQGPDMGAYEYQGTRTTKLIGCINKDTTLSKGTHEVGSPILNIIDGVQVRIAAGAKLVFPEGSTFKVFGSLKVEGTSSDSVLFNASSGYWKGLQFMDWGMPHVDVRDSSTIRYGIFTGGNEDFITHGKNTIVHYSHCSFRDMISVRALAITNEARVELDSSEFIRLNEGLTIGYSPISSDIGQPTVKGKGTSVTLSGGRISLYGNTTLEGWLIQGVDILLQEGTHLVRNTVIDSSILTVGGGAQVRLVGSIVTHGPQTYAAIKDYGNLTIVNSTLADNRHYAISAENTQVTIRNSILWNNYGGNGVPQINVVGSKDPVISYSNIQNGWGGTGNIDSDPLFEQNGYQLTSNSPCVNKGDSVGNIALLSPKDIGGGDRFRGSKLDLGAYELQSGTIVDAWKELTTGVHSIIQRRIWGRPVRLNQFDLMGRHSN